MLFRYSIYVVQVFNLINRYRQSLTDLAFSNEEEGYQKIDGSKVETYDKSWLTTRVPLEVSDML